MLNERAEAFFKERIEAAIAMSAEHHIGAEIELGVASGILAYACMSGDISITEHQVLHRHIAAARAECVNRLCNPELGACA